MAIALTSGKVRKVRPSMNVTPLVDVVLVLLIIFMVLTPLMTKQISVNVPVEQKDDVDVNPPDESEPQVVLNVQSDGAIRINRDVVSDSNLSSKLRRIFAARSDQTLFFDASDSVSYERAVEVIDVARGAGIRTIAVLTQPLEQ